MRLSRVLAAGTAPLLALPLFTAVPAAAVPPAATGTQTVVVMLRSADPAALTALARSAPRDRALRARQVAALRPTSTQRTRAIDALRAMGLRVTQVSRWSVRASGSATTIRSLFGSARAVRPHLRRAAGLPRVPAALSGLVTGVFGGDETRPVAFPRYTYDTAGYHGDQLRSAYSTLAATVPSSPPGPEAPTIATVQLSGWRPGDLATYARYVGLPYNPITSGQVVSKSVDGADPLSNVDPYGGADEVALDQQALLAMAPAARQRIYFARNDSLEGYPDAVYAVGDDASDNAQDGYHLTALSLSWGACEDALDTPSDPYYRTMEQALAYAVATGVTVFAASGDAGAYDCYGQPGATAPAAPAVDYPASSRYVVGVGGTNLAQNTDGSWSESGWSGSGGGQSRLWNKPSWQASVGSTATTRMVPDISAVGDPASGFAAYLGPSGWQRVGGTSLGAPVTAGLLTQTLLANGYTYGVGDIHPALYASPAAAFRDVTSGSNPGSMSGGYAAGPGYDQVTGLGSPLWENLRPTLAGDPHVHFTTGAGDGAQYASAPNHPVVVHVSAPAWYPFGSYVATANPAAGTDPCASSTPVPSTFTPTQVGWNELDVAARDSAGFCHVGATAILVDSKRPVVTKTVARQVKPTGSALIFGWVGADPSVSSNDPTLASGVRDYAYRIRRSGLTRPVVDWTWTTATNRTLAAGVSSGQTYVLDVRVRDRALNVSSIASTRVTVPIEDRHFAFSAGWHRTTTSAAYGGSWMTAGARGASTSVAATARKYTVWLTFTPTGGKAAIYIGSTLVKTVDTYSSITRPRVPVTVYSSPTIAQRTFVLRVLGQRSTSSHGTNVTVDALVPAI